MILKQFVGNPRTSLRNHRERGKKKFSYTYKDLAELYGVSIARVKQLASTNKEKVAVLNPRSLLSIVSLYINRLKDKN